MPTQEQAAMFRHILLPIDGSELSEKAVRSGVRLARTFGARVTAFHMKPKVDGFTAVMDGFEKMPRGDRVRCCRTSAALPRRRVSIATS
jgi:nucleotide-binding universal stress UspA family protein